MQRTEDGGCRFSATDLVNYLGCRHATYLDMRSLEEDLEKAESDETMRLLQRKGLEHEKAYLERLRTEGRDIVEIDRDGIASGPGGPRPGRPWKPAWTSSSRLCSTGSPGAAMPIS